MEGVALPPPLVIICGPPASGKSTIADHLARSLGLPVLAKDLMKEAMMNHLGGSEEVGAAAFAVQFAIARELLRSGTGLVLEGAFLRRQAEIAELARLGTTVVVDVSCKLEVLERRYVERHPQRHPGHRGPEALPDLKQRVAAGEYGVPDLGRPTLAVDTTDRMDPPEHEVLEWVRSKLKVGGEP
jgi:predicted kinase